MFNYSVKKLSIFYCLALICWVLQANLIPVHAQAVNIKFNCDSGEQISYIADENIADIDDSPVHWQSIKQDTERQSFLVYFNKEGEANVTAQKNYKGGASFPLFDFYTFRLINYDLTDRSMAFLGTHENGVVTLGFSELIDGRSKLIRTDYINGVVYNMASIEIRSCTYQEL